VVEETRRKVPVIVQVGAADTRTSVALARHAESIGADAIACVTPYHNQPDEEGLIKHYRRVNEAVKLPVFVYNIPRLTGANVKPETMVKLAAMDRIVGVKDSSRDFLQLLDIIEMFPPDFSVISGSEGFILPALLMGAKGAVSALANTLPELFVDLHDAYMEGNLERAREIQFRIIRVKRLAEKPVLSPIYEILRLRGVDCGNPRSPMRPMTENERSGMLKGLQSLGVL